jgi:hypothetical protein
MVVYGRIGVRGCRATRNKKVNMNKAFVREPELDGKAYCPQCGTLGIEVGRATLDHHIALDHRTKLADDAWFCDFAKCQVAYFDMFDRIVITNELISPVYPKDSNAPLCPCFGFTMEDVDAAIDKRSPIAIRQLLEKSKTKDANCRILAPSGQCCMQEVQRLYIRGVGVTG